MSDAYKMNRRKFLGTASCAAVGTTTFLSTLFNLGMANEAAARNRNQAAQGEDYRALVCILLAGGNDSFNMLAPRNSAAHGEYVATRSNLALPLNSLLPIRPVSGADPELGLHPSMPEVQSLFAAGKVAFLSNVGTLVEPTTKQQYEAGAVRLPLGLFSHADQIQQWQTSVPQNRSALGWGGRMADILQSMNSNQAISMNISLSGRNFFQSGTQTAEYTIRPDGNGSIGLEGYGDGEMEMLIRKRAVDSLMEQHYNDVFRQTYANIIRNAQGTHEQFSEAIGGVNLASSFSESELSASMAMAARTIAARDQLGARRQTFFITFGGWDHHDEVLNNQAAMLTVVSKALSEFQSAMEELALADKVTTFTISDFARTLTSNGNGSDHAWGGNVLVVGGAVNGGRIYGRYPSLALGSALEIGNGVLIPEISTDEYFAELASWFGVSNADLRTIFPNLANFHRPEDGAPIGFLKA